MLTNYLKTALRNLYRYRGYSAINVGGLTLGYTVATVIALYLFFEISYDRFPADSERIYRLTVEHTSDEGVTEHHAGISADIGPILKEEFPVVQEQARMINTRKIMRSSAMSTEEPGATVRSFHETGIYFADPAVLTLFDFEMVYGDRENAMSDPNSLVISRSAARKYFGDENPLGRTLRLNRELAYTVAGVFRDLPRNTHMHPDILLPFQSAVANGLIFQPNLHLFGAEYHTYLLLGEGGDRTALEERLLEAVSSRTDRRWEKTSLELQALEEIHLHSDLIGEHEANGSAMLVYAMGVIAVVILAMAWLNFVNLSVIKNSMRLREIGVRKTLGAGDRQVRTQFLVEALLVNTAALVCALLLFELVHPLLSGLIGYPIPGLRTLGAAGTGLLALFFAGGTVLSGYVSGWTFSHVKPSVVLKGRITPSMTGDAFRKVVVTFQFACVYVLIAGTLTVHRQIRYMQNKDLGMNIEHMVVLRGPELSINAFETRREAVEHFYSSYGTFKAELLRRSTVAGLATSNYVPGDAIGFQASLRREEGSNSLLVKRIFADEDFADVFGIEILAGRFFAKDGNDGTVVLNRSASELLGFETPVLAVGREILYFGAPARVIGVVDDFHFSGLKNPVEPLFFHHNLDWTYFTIKLQEGATEATLVEIEQLWGDIFDGSPFEYFLTDAYYGQEFTVDRRTNALVSSFSLVAVLIACLGLFGLTSLSFIRKMKEIGIRKVLGATNFHIVGLMAKKYLHLILLSVIIAFPASYYLAGSWLGDFAYRIELNWGLFVLPLAVVLLVTGMTFGLLMRQAVTIEPLKSIQSE